MQMIKSLGPKLMAHRVPFDLVLGITGYLIKGDAYKVRLEEPLRADP